MREFDPGLMKVVQAKVGAETVAVPVWKESEVPGGDAADCVVPLVARLQLVDLGVMPTEQFGLKVPKALAMLRQKKADLDPAAAKLLEAEAPGARPLSIPPPPPEPGEMAREPEPAEAEKPEGAEGDAKPRSRRGRAGAARPGSDDAAAPAGSGEEGPG